MASISYNGRDATMSDNLTVTGTLTAGSFVGTFTGLSNLYQATTSQPDADVVLTTAELSPNAWLFAASLVAMPRTWQLPTNTALTTLYPAAVAGDAFEVRCYNATGNLFDFSIIVPGADAPTLTGLTAVPNGSCLVLRVTRLAPANSWNVHGMYKFGAQIV